MSAYQITPEAIEEQAAQWIVQLTADDPAERDAAARAYAAWKAHDQRHHDIANRIELFLARTRTLQSDSAQARAGKHALQQVLAGSGRRNKRLSVGSTMLAALFLLISSLLVIQQFNLLPLGADIKAPRNRIISQTLQDGSKLTLAGNSAVKLHFTNTERRIELLGGQLHLNIAKDPARPLVVETDKGEIRALGTRFIVREQSETTVLDMLESSVAVRPRKAPQPETVVKASERLVFTQNRIMTHTSLDGQGSEAAFMAQRMILDNEPLENVLNELARHKSGLLQVNRKAVAGLRISGILPLNDCQSALDMIKATFPQLTVSRYAGDYLVLVH